MRETEHEQNQTERESAEFIIWKSAQETFHIASQG